MRKRRQKPAIEGDGELSNSAIYCSIRMMSGMARSGGSQQRSAMPAILLRVSEDAALVELLAADDMERVAPAHQRGHHRTEALISYH
jgi:hypothetical protein